MADHLELPVALRRTRRESTTPRGNMVEPEVVSAGPAASRTPSRRRTATKKHVRFSDPGPITDDNTEANDDGRDGLSTGLTPMIRRTTLKAMTPKSAKTRRRNSTPARASLTRPASANIFDRDTPSSPMDGDMHFLPLRQVIDGRVKRRLRRNGLSEEMNSAHAEKRARVRETQAALAALRAAVAEKDEEIKRLQDQTIDYDTERVWELEQEVARLRDLLAADSRPRQEQQHGAGDATAPSSPSYDWTHAARDPFSEDYMAVDNEDDGFGETTMADLVCSTPTRRANQSFHSIPTPPTTSPPGLPVTPTSQRYLLTPRSHAGVQAALPDPGRLQAEEELASLQLEVCKLTTTLESYQAMAARLSDQLSAAGPAPSSDAGSPVGPNASSPQAGLETHLAQLLTTLSDRTATLLSLNSSLSDLGFPGADASEIITSLSSAFRSARLELEYLTPGEITLPLTSASAATLDLLLTRLRDLARHAREADDQIDEYHALELSLRQQLGVRVDMAEELAQDFKRLEGEVGERDARVAELEVGVERLKGAVKGYVRDVKELETLVVRLEKDLGEANGRVEAERAEKRGLLKEKEDGLARKTAAVAELETKLTAAVARTEEVLGQLEGLEAKHQAALLSARDRHKASQAALNRTHGGALALRDARVAELRGEIDRVNASLRAAHETMRSLRVENGQLASRVEDEKRRAKEAVDAVKAELERVVRMSEGLLGTPNAKVARIGLVGSRGSASQEPKAAATDGAEDDDVVVVTGPDAPETPSRKGKSKKRRRYDSGLGFLDEDEVEMS